MSELSKKIRDTAKQGKLIPAQVVDIFFDKATVKLANNGMIMRGLKITGGPIKAGQSVHVDFTTPEPTVVAIGVEGLTNDDLAKALAKISTQGLSSIPKIQIMLFSGGAAVDSFPPSVDGLIAAVGSAAKGDVVWIPDITIEADITVPAGVCVTGISSRETLIKGMVVLNDESTIEQLKVVNTDVGATEVCGVAVNASTKPAFIRNCEVHGYSCGTGRANGIEMGTNGKLFIKDSIVIADTGGNLAYAFKGATGSTCDVSFSRYHGSSGIYDGTGFSEYCNSEADLTEIEFFCALPSGTGVAVYWAASTWAGSYTPSDFYGVYNVTPPNTPASTKMFDISNDLPAHLRGDGTYVYFYKYAGTSVVIREWDISEGSYIDIQVCTNTYTTQSTPFALVGSRKMLVFRDAEGRRKHQIYLVDFATQTSTLYYQFEQMVPYSEYYQPDDPTAYYYNPAHMVSVIQSNSDLVIVINGESNHWDPVIGMSYHGTWVLTKNWTQDGPWEFYETPLHPVELDIWGVDVTCWNLEPYIVGNRYFIIIPYIDSTYAVDSMDTPIENVYIGMFVYDIQDKVFTSVYNSYPTVGGGGGAPNFYHGCVNHPDQCALAEVDAYDIEAGKRKIYKFDPVALTITELLSENSTTEWNFLYSKEQVYYIRMATQNDIYKIDGTLVKSNWAPPLSDYQLFWNVQHHIDSLSRVWYFSKDDGLVHGYSLLTDEEITFDPEVSPGTRNQISIVPLGNVFVLETWNLNDASLWIVKE